MAPNHLTPALDPGYTIRTIEFGTSGHGRKAMRYALLGVLFLACLATPAQASLPDPQACDVDADCFHTGCSGQLCASAIIITTCEFTCEYGCYQVANCECRGHRCGFQQSATLRDCLRACREGGGDPVPAAGGPDASCSTDPAVLLATGVPAGQPMPTDELLLATESLSVCP